MCVASVPLGSVPSARRFESQWEGLGMKQYVLSALEITIDPQDILRAQRVRPRPDLLAALEKAIALGASLWQPQAVYAWGSVQKVDGETLHLTADLSLKIGPHADLLAPAKWLLVTVYTIGPALEARVSELYRAGEPLLSYMLDCAGVMALGMVGERLRCLAEERAAGRGWGVSPALSPGSLVGWPVQGQRELCSLLPLADIGVRLNEYCVLEPHKSVSMVIGLGPGYESHEVGSVCHICALRDTCWRRRESEA